MTRAILSGAGRLPALLLEAGPAHIVQFEGVPSTPLDAPLIEARFEQLGGLFEALKAEGVTELCLAGAMTRPILDPSAFDPRTVELMPRILPTLSRGDDALLSTIVSILEDEGFSILGAHDIRPDLLAEEGVLAGMMSDAKRSDAARARAVLEALSPLDVGQVAVASKGQILAIETAPGTDAMLDFIAKQAPSSGGVFVKRSKQGQDLRVDMPSIGPDTVRRADEAGLSGLCIEAGGVLVLDREDVISEAQARGIALWAEA